MLQLGYIKWEIQHTRYKKVSSDQEWNSIDSSWVNKQMWQVCAILGNAICHWIVNDTKNETDKDFLKKY